MEKLWADVAGRPLLHLTLTAVAAAELFEAVVIVAPRARWVDVIELSREAGLTGVQLVEGGATRQASVRAGLGLCEGLDHVCIHDAARPLCSTRLFHSVMTAAREHDAATAAIALVDTAKRVEEGIIVDTPDRRSLMAAQTPQCFTTSLIVSAHDRARDRGTSVDDDCTLVEQLGRSVHVVEGDPENFKVTRPIDLTLLRALVAERAGG